MANIISVNVTKRTVGGEAVINNALPGTKNINKYSPAVIRGFDTNDIISPIRFNGTESYFTTKELRDMDIVSRKDEQITWNSSDSLATLASKSPDLIVLTVLFKDETRQVNMHSEPMVFNVNKMMTGGALVPRVSPLVGTIFNYIEEGNPNPMQYTVLETIAMIAAAVGPIVLFNGRDLYVNDLSGNDATAQKGDPLRPWLNATAALAAAVAGDTVVLLEGSGHILANAYKAGVNIEVRTNATLTVTAYVASGVGNQKIYGGGTVTLTGASGFSSTATFDGTIKINIGTLNINGALGGTSISTHNSVFDFNADYVNIGAACTNAYICGGNSSFNWRVKIKQSDNSAQHRNTFFINASSPNAVIKTFDINIANGNSLSSNEAFLLLHAIDDSYGISVNGVILFNGTAGSPCFDAVFAAYQCTGGQLIIGGGYSILGGRFGIIVNSAILKVTDNAIVYQDTANTKSLLALSGGTSIYNFNGNKRSFSHTEGINIGAFTGANNSATFGAIASSVGTDILNFKGAMRQAYLNVAAIGILVANDQLIVDGGIIEMSNGVGNEAYSAPAPQNIKVYGSGLTNGIVSANLTNIIPGPNIISDPNVVVNV